MAGPKTNERPRGATTDRPGTRAVLRYARIAPNKVREVLDLVRNKPVQEAEDILRFSERDAAFVVGKVLHSAVANAENNDELDPEELYVSACFADEGTTVKRWRPRARGRATRIRKRTSHITVIVSRLPDDRLERLRAHRRAEQLAQRARRVAGARRSEGDTRSRAERRRRGAAAEVEEAEVQEADVDEPTTDAVDETASAAPGDVSAAEVAALADEQDIVDVDALAVAESEAGEVEETAADRAVAERAAGTSAGQVEAGEDDAGIVDETGAGAAAEEGDAGEGADEAETAPEGPDGTPEEEG